ncbi:hypothetical protein O181_058987 [Austropuccinia psidii MF-1]|uniref:Uncharacterized protein n=1 Tax=Austropuccinia psidii MF-1 TaxID=1389203 RepID=A0A9Q3EKV1_9BASI|nr:hypothetical protein [Austropuccinia psidii MF-1]
MNLCQTFKTFQLEFFSIPFEIYKSSCHALCVLSGVFPAFAPQQQQMPVMLANKNPRNALLLSNPSDHMSRGIPAQDALARTPLWLTMMKAYLSGNGHRDPKKGGRNASGQLALSPQVLICPPSNGHFSP